LIAFDRIGEDGYYDVWVVRSEGADPRCLTCDNPQLPRHNGNPTWHPSGDYIAFQSQDPDLSMFPLWFRLLPNIVASPGGAINNNLWVMTADGREFWQLTHVKNGMGVLHPHFSDDGSRLIWAEKISLNPKGARRPDTWGEWAIKLADFYGEGAPAIGSIEEIKPGDLQFFETHGFFPGDGRIIFSAFERGAALGSLDIFVYDLDTGELRNLTNTPYEWDEHGQVLPDGSRIIWVSSTGIEQNRDRAGDITASRFKMDFWIMDADGANKQRLTYFNEPGAPEYISAGIVTADSTLSPDGKTLAGRIRITSNDPLRDEVIVQIELP
jgi:Tol biopolymer transport system component